MHTTVRLAFVAVLLTATVGAAAPSPDPVAGLTADRAAALVAEGGRPLSEEEILAATRLGLSGQPPAEASILAVPDVKELTPRAAAALGRYRGAVLALDGLDDLSAETAAALAEFSHEDGVLDLGGDVPHLHPWFGFLSLGGLRTIRPEAAAALAACTMNLLLDDLTTLSPDVATALAAHRGVLSLEGVRTMSGAAATALAKHRGEHLVLDGLTTLSPEAAAALARYEGARLSLNGLEKLSPATARALAAYEGALRLQGLKSLSPDVAEALAASTGTRLSLSGLTTLPAETAAALAEYLGEKLILNGLVEISDEAAAALAGCAAKLDLQNMTTMSDAARASLAKHVSANDDAVQKTYVICAPRLTGDMLPLMNVVATRQEEVILANITALDGEDAVAAARLLAAVDGRVCLPRLKRVSSEAYKTLRQAPNVVLPATEAITVGDDAHGTGAPHPETP
mgnify:CR=1 FL=1